MRPPARSSSFFSKTSTLQPSCASIAADTSAPMPQPMMETLLEPPAGDRVARSAVGCNPASSSIGRSSTRSALEARPEPLRTRKAWGEERQSEQTRAVRTALMVARVVERTYVARIPRWHGSIVVCIIGEGRPRQRPREIKTGGERSEEWMEEFGIYLEWRNGRNVTEGVEIGERGNA
eukprot:scaffold2771_cov252-Pinguiococcus_pyrenoidosus.AAC.23